MDAFFLRRALELAERRRGFCAPNPAVGAVLVKDGRIVSEGFHWEAGKPHAEVEALGGLTPEQCQGTTLYVSLEPCNHQGRTPPCTGLIADKGIGQVVYGHEDPNPKVQGLGAAALLKSGIQVRHVPMGEIRSFYESYGHWVRTRKPFVTAKLALSLDGKTAGPGGAPLPLTGPDANRFTHEQRLRTDAVLTTARTVLADDPRLNARLHGMETPKPIAILDRTGRTPVSARLFQTAQTVTIFTGEQAPESKLRALEQAGAQVVVCQTGDGPMPLPEVVSQLGQIGYHDVWVEGGAALFTAFLKHRLAQKAYLYLAPVIVGHGVSAFESNWEGLLPDASLKWIPQGRDVMAEVVW